MWCGGVVWCGEVPNPDATLLDGSGLGIFGLVREPRKKPYIGYGFGVWGLGFGLRIKGLG
jgi:hypothetical protein